MMAKTQKTSVSSSPDRIKLSRESSTSNTSLSAIKKKRSLKRTASKLIRNPFGKTKNPDGDSGSFPSLVNDDEHDDVPVKGEHKSSGSGSDESLGLDDTRRKVPPLLLPLKKEKNSARRSSISTSGSTNREKSEDAMEDDCVGLDGTRRKISLLDLLGPAGGSSGGAGNNGGTSPTADPTQNTNDETMSNAEDVFSVSTTPARLENARTEEEEEGTIDTNEKTIRLRRELKRQGSSCSLDKEAHCPRDPSNTTVDTSNTAQRGVGGYTRTNISMAVCFAIAFAYYSKYIMFRPSSSSNSTNDIMYVSQIATGSILLIGLFIYVTKAAPRDVWKARIVNES